MNKIKFSYRFSKLFKEDGTQVRVARLLQVIEVDLSDLSTDFINYDTDTGAYTLPIKGAYLLLIFHKIADGGNGIFTTIRRSIPTKLEYYQNQVGQLFEVVVTEKEPAV